MPSNLARAALVAFWASLMVEQVLAQQTQPTVNWLSPTKGDDYVAGDTITVKWENSQALNAPNILLCYSSRGELSRNKQECAPETYPSDGAGAGTHSLDVTIPAVLGQDTFIFLIGDASGNRFLSPPFSIRPPGIPLVKASDVLPKTTPTATSAAAPSAITNGPVTAAVDKSSNDKGSAAIGLGTSLSIAGFAILLFCFFIWRHQRRKAKRKAAEADLEAGANVSRSSSFTSSLRKTSASGVERYTPQDSLTDVPRRGKEKEETSHKEPHGALPFFNIMSRESSAASKTSNLNFVRAWLPPIPRVWRFFGEEKTKSRNSTPAMTPVGSQISQLSRTASSRAAQPPSLRPGNKDRSVMRHSTSSSSTSSSFATSFMPSSISGVDSPVTQAEEEEAAKQGGVEQDKSEEHTHSPPMADSELLQPIPKVYHPESIGAALDGLRQRERDTVASLDSFERA